ncbi:MAG: acyl carrier protein [Gemmatimonadota bacterium]
MTPTNEDRVRVAVRAALHRIAPEVDFDGIDPAAELREEADLDSVDLLNLAVILDESLKVAIPESDYEQVATLEGMTRYLAGRLSSEP